MTHEPDAEQLMRLKFQLAMSIGESLDLVPMVRRFIVPLLQSVQGLSCLVWLNDWERAGTNPKLIAYPQRRLEDWQNDPVLRAHLDTCVASTQPHSSAWQHGARSHFLAMPVEHEGWLVIETSENPLPPAVQEGIGVLLKRLARACRACHEHGRAQQLLREREAAEQQRMLAHQRMHEVLALSTDGFVYFDDTARIALCNPAAAELLNRPSANLIGHRADELDACLAQRLGPDSTAPGFSQRLAQLAAKPAHANSANALDSQSGQLQLMQPRPIELIWSLRPVLANGLAVLYLRDISQEVEVDRMKTEFLATAAHELRTPLASILGFTELLLHRNFTEEKRRELMEIVHRQSELLARLVQELLDLSRIEARSGKDFCITACPLSDLVSAARLRLKRPQDAERIQVEMPPDLQVMADAEQIERALAHLLSNACEFSPEGTAVTVRAHCAPDVGSGWVAIEVIDQGIGMTPEQLERAFERFYRADASGHRPGTGLGLNLVKEIANVHGGSVSLASEAGHGTVATLRLRLANPAGYALSQGTSPAPSVATSI